MESSKPRRQRKWSYSKKQHSIHKDFSSHLSKDLRKQIGRRSLEIREGDTIKVMRGNKNLVGKLGKITAVVRAKRMVLAEGVIGKRANGNERQIPLRPSNLLLVAVEDKDSRRLKGRKTVKETKKA